MTVCLVLVAVRLGGPGDGETVSVATVSEQVKKVR